MFRARMFRDQRASIITKASKSEVNDGMVSPLKRHRNVPNLELNNQVNKVRRPR